MEDIRIQLIEQMIKDLQCYHELCHSNGTRTWIVNVYNHDVSVIDIQQATRTDLSKEDSAQYLEEHDYPIADKYGFISRMEQYIKEERKQMNNKIEKNIRMMVIAMVAFILTAGMMVTVVYGIQLFAWMAVEAHDAGANIVGTIWMLMAVGFAGAVTLFIGALGFAVVELWDGLKKVKSTW